jgi:hypothetical protein
MDECLKRNFEGFNSQSISNVLWSCATLHVIHGSFFNAVAQECMNLRLNDFQAQEFSNLLWSIATSKI